MQMRLIITGLLAISLSGCGGGGGSSDTPAATATTPSTGSITLSGKITYDLVPVDSDNIGLDYDNIRQEAAKGVQVDAIDSTNNSVASTLTDAAGSYSFSVPNNTAIKIRVFAKMFKSGTPSWDVKVVNQNNANAVYTIEGSLVSTGTNNATRNLNAASGWGDNSYTTTRSAAPFAMLDTIYSAMQKVLSADAQAVFPPLTVNWYEGSTDGTYYTNGGLYIYGDEDWDTDEYDKHVIAHEWGHYYEDKFSRLDSIGGNHAQHEHLDIRVAFSEGWGNAFSAMALDDPVYVDTLGSQQAYGFNINVETETHNYTPGWFSEASIQRILYDLYDSTDDGNDTLSLGFTPIHEIFTGTQVTTPAFTSLFTFIKNLKDEGIDDNLIDALVSSENIAPITDIWGNGRTNSSTLYPYSDLALGGTVHIKTSNSENDTTLELKDRSRNKLDNRQYVKFGIAATGNYTIKVQQTNGTDSDPDFYLYKGSPFGYQDKADKTTQGIEEESFNLTSGDYLLDITDYNNITNAQFDVTIN